MLIDNDENDDEEEDKMKENKRKLKRTKGKIDNNNKKQKRDSKKQRCDNKVRERVEDDGVNYEYELNKSKKIESKLKKGCNLAYKDYDRLSKESALVEKSYEMLVDKLKKKIIKDMFVFQNEKHLEVK